MKSEHLNKIGIAWCGNACEWSGGCFKHAYDLIIQTWTEAHLEPTHVSATAPGVGKDYGTFKSKRRLIEKAGLENVEVAEFAYLPEGGVHISFDSVLKAMISRRLSLFALMYMPAIVGAMAARILDKNIRELIVVSGCQYAYMLQQPKIYSPDGYAYRHSADIHDDWRSDELRHNIQNWNPEIAKLAPLLSAGILRNIYTENYLSQPHLSARLGRTPTTLKEWIRADPAGRGTLEPFNDILTKWSPPVEKIPQIREELYRAGRVFYWRFMRPGFRNAQGGMTPEALFRPDLSAPWEAPDPIPEIYRAHYWKDKDPGLTY